MAVARYGAHVRIVTAYVVFEGSDLWHWWFVFLPRAWRHVWVALPAPWPDPGLLETNFTMKFEPLSWGIDTAVFWEDPAIVVRAFVEGKATCAVQFRIRIPLDNSTTWVPRGIYTCVSAAKSVLGLRCWWIWTPRSLCRYLLAHCDGRLMVKGDDDGKDDFVDLQRAAQTGRT